MPSVSSALNTLHAFGVPRVYVCPSGGAVSTSGRPRSQAHSSRPLIGSKPRTTPEGSCVSTLSATQPPSTATPFAKVGGEVT